MEYANNDASSTDPNNITFNLLSDYTYNVNITLTMLNNDNNAAGADMLDSYLMAVLITILQLFSSILEHLMVFGRMEYFMVMNRVQLMEISWYQYVVLY